MKDPILERNHTNAKLVTSILAQQEICKHMKDSIQERNRTNAKVVTSVLAEQEV